MSIQSRRIIIFFFLTINLSYKVRQKDINIEELAQFEKTRQGFWGAAPNKLEVQGVAQSSVKCKSLGGARAVSLSYLNLNTNLNLTVVCIINCRSISPAFVWPPNKLSTSMWDWQVSWTHVPARLHGETTGETTKTNTCTKFLVAVSPNQNSRISGWHAIWWPDKSRGLGPAVYYANSCKPV